MSKITAIFLLLLVAFLQLNLFKPGEQINHSLTISNGINTLRGQSIEAGLADPLPRIFFNKVHYLIVGSLQWLRHLSPGVLFEFAPKILIIPLTWGIIGLIKRWPKDWWLPVTPILITLPSTLFFPAISYQLIVLTTPFLLLVAVRGLGKFSRPVQLMILIGLVIELVGKI